MRTRVYYQLFTTTKSAVTANNDLIEKVSEMEMISKQCKQANTLKTEVEVSNKALKNYSIVKVLVHRPPKGIYSR